MSSSNDSKPDNYQTNAKICRLVERYPCMYDRSHSHYLKKDVVDKAWIKISKEMDDSIPSCKERWRNIRTSFARSINVNKIPASANRTKPYYLHEELQFLARHITPGIPVSRRSNVYYSASEESEAIEVAVGEESFDGFAALAQKEEEEEEEEEEMVSQGRQSSIEESNEAAKCEEVRTVEQMQQQQLELLKQQQLQLQQQQHQQIQQQKQAQLQEQQQQKQQPIVQEEREAEVAAYITPLCPPKKRLRVLEMPVVEIERECVERERERERERDIKPIEMPQESTSSDFDAMFLQGILPEMKAMDFRQKIIFKRRIYEVIGEIFESSSSQQHCRGNPSQTIVQTAIPTTTTTPTHSYAAVAATPPAATMTVVNAADLAMIRRLNTLLQSPHSPASSSHVTAVPKSVASISSTVRTTSPATATVAVHRGALTRSSTNLLRVTMVNHPGPISSSSSSSSSIQAQTVKQEPELVDD